MGQLLGVLLHSLGGFSSASFYVPTYKIKKWSWETSWIVLGFIAWVVMPVIGCWIVTENMGGLLVNSAGSGMIMTYFFGVLWGFGGLFSGLGLRYLGLALGQSISLGVSSVVGTLVPVFIQGKVLEVFTKGSGKLVLLGLTISILGIVLCGLAGRSKEKIWSVNKVGVKEKAEFSAGKGITVAVIGGIFSACMAIAIMFGSSISSRALEFGTAEIFMNIPIFVIAFAGGFTTNVLYVGFKSYKNKTVKEFLMKPGNLLLRNYGLAIFSGIMWYLQFFFYGMGATRMGDHEFASWSIHMSSIVLFSNFWGIALKEWEGVSNRTRLYLWLGILLLLISILIIGLGNHT